MKTAYPDIDHDVIAVRDRNMKSDRDTDTRCTCPHCGRSFNYCGTDFTGEAIIETFDDMYEDQYFFCTCSKCGHSWNSIKEAPKRCPSCGSYRWTESKVILDCKRCGYVWEARGNMKPARCPRCRSLSWMKPNSPPQIAKGIVIDAVREDYERRFAEAMERCLQGEPVWDVCVELDVAIIEVMLTLRGYGKGQSDDA